ncbi:MAG: hypothetical protein WA970_12040 [Gammaproteobacteria bacterium]
MSAMGRFRTFAEVSFWEKPQLIYERSLASVKQSVAEIHRRIVSVYLTA